MQPDITISSLDAERLEALIDTMRADDATSRALLEELARAEIRAPHDMPPDVVTMNSTVRFEIEGAAGQRCLTLAYPRDMPRLQDGISILSPVGSALLGLKAGDSIDWPRSDGQPLRVRLLDVVYQPERAGEYFR